jgi:hypothetical protein
MPVLRDFQKIKSMDDFRKTDPPILVDGISQPTLPPLHSQMILRMLVRPKYGDFRIPSELSWLESQIREAAALDAQLTGIKDSWCYVTVRHGPTVSKTDDEWHFDGASFRTGLIPERNYIWVNHTGPQYKTGEIEWPEDFDPTKHNLFTYASRALSDADIQTAPSGKWMIMTPFCLHRRDPATNGTYRTFLRISFPDIEGRDINNTHNHLLPTPFFGRDPVKDFRNHLKDYSNGDHNALP